MTDLRVPVELATMSRATIAAGEAMRRRFLTWCRANGYPGSDPAPTALLRWASGLDVTGNTARSYVALVRVGWLSTARCDPPGYAQARSWARGKARKEARNAPATGPKRKSRAAAQWEVEAVCAAAVVGEVLSHIGA